MKVHGSKVPLGEDSSGSMIDIKIMAETKRNSETQMFRNFTGLTLMKGSFLCQVRAGGTPAR